MRLEAGELSHHNYVPFINGDPAFVPGPYMVVPIGDADFDFEQSSNRMPIE